MRILRLLDPRAGETRLCEFFERAVTYAHDLMYSDRTYADLTAEGNDILQSYVRLLAIEFPLRVPTVDEKWYQNWTEKKRDAADVEALGAIAYRSWDVAFFAAAYVGLRHGAFVRRVIPDLTVARKFHEEGGEHHWTWIYFFVSLMGIAVSDGPHEADSIAFVVFGGSQAGNPPFSARGRRVRAVNRRYARIGGHMDPMAAN